MTTMISSHPRQESVAHLSKEFKRIHSTKPSGRLHRGHHVVAASSTIPTKYQTVVISNAEKKGFNSMEKRFQYDDQNEMPSPAQYVGHHEVKTDNVSMSRRGLGGFASRSTRILKQVPPISAPPDSYNISTKIMKDDFNRYPATAVFHKPISQKTNKGPGPSPADYTPNIGLLGKNRLITAHAAFDSKSRRELINTKESRLKPSPDKYDPNDRPLKASVREIGSVFNSKTKRTMGVASEAVPGPGAYKPWEQVEPVKKTIFPKKHYLCLSAPAMPLPPANPQPGPGHYDVVDYDGEPKHFMSSSVFLSNVGRWAPDTKGATLPGPPHYHPKENNAKQSFIYNAAGKWVS